MSDRKDLIKLIIAIVLCVAVIGFLGFSSFKKFKAISDLESLAIEKNTALETADKKLEQLISLKENRHLYSRQQEMFEKIIPKEPQERELYEFIKEVTDAYNVYIEGMEFQGGVNRENYREMPVALQIAGSYNGVIQAIEGIQSGDRMINIMEMGIIRGAAGNIQATLRLEAFFRSPSQSSSSLLQKNSTGVRAENMNTRQYIGNKNTGVLHVSTCSSLPSNENRVYFNNKNEALNAGYRGCKRCMG